MQSEISRRVGALQGLAVNSLRQIIRWSSDFETNQPRIDAQHENIFRLALEASELSRDQASRDRLAALFDTFCTVLNAHFADEERLLSDIGYPRLEEHRAEHGAIRSELQFIRQRCASGGPGWAMQQQALVVTNFMIGVTVGHILRSDADYAQFLQRDPSETAGSLAG